ncbi:MAG: hypothetical protein K0R75_2107 [Paenibacillaceae bacterium]|jgi:hypothetical protein|nr:hypothetical protein [Paenibacillaceae bacterium]
MINDEQLDQFRVNGTLLRVIRDISPENDVKGIVVAWNEREVMIRKANRKIVKLDRGYMFQPFVDPRPELPPV